MAFSDPIKKDARQAVSTLKKMGMQVVMLTGDNHKTAECIGKLVTNLFFVSVYALSSFKKTLNWYLVNSLTPLIFLALTAHTATFFAKKPLLEKIP